MRTLTTAVCVIVVGMLVVQAPLLARGGGAAHARGGGAFGNGGFHGGSIGNAGHVNNRPYYGGGYYGYGYQMGQTGFEGDGDLGGSGGGSGSITAYTGTGGGPPGELQDGRGVNKSPSQGDTGGPSWDSDWWDHDPHPEDHQAASGVVGATVASLPMGGDTVYLSSQSYYYYAGRFYESTDSGYAVVAAPIGISVRTLPDEADLINVNGQQYFQLGDVYYQALYSGNGLVYKVVEDPHSSS